LATIWWRRLVLSAPVRCPSDGPDQTFLWHTIGWRDAAEEQLRQVAPPVEGSPSHKCQDLTEALGQASQTAGDEDDVPTIIVLVAWPWAVEPSSSG
jgi:hypothetical protein